MLNFSIFFLQFSVYFQGLVYLLLFLAFLVVLASNIYYSVIFLLGFYFVGGLTMILLGAEYIGLIFIIVYLGAIAILFLFVVMLFNYGQLQTNELELKHVFKFVCVVFLLIEIFTWGKVLYPLNGVVYGALTNFQNLLTNYQSLLFVNDPVSALAFYFFNYYYWFLIFLGLLLFVILIGVVMLLRNDIPRFEAEADRASNQQHFTYYKLYGN